MDERAIASVEEITEEWVTGVLRGREYLERGRVERVEKRNYYTTTTSTIVHLGVEYTEGADKTAAERLLVKMVNPEVAVEVMRVEAEREVAFYRAVLENDGYELPVPRCYAAAYDEEQATFHLLMDDVSETHHIPYEWPVPPPLAQCEMVIDSLAQLHARWWGSTSFGREIRPNWLDDERDRKYVGEVEKMLAGFVDYMGDNLTKERLRYYELALEKAPALLAQRYRSGKHLTLVHGDTHLWNYMYPRDPKRDRVLMIDWQSAGIAVAAGDLAYMITVHWYPERRARLEQPLLRRYYERLLEYGVTGYSWDDFWYDYRLEFIWLIFNAVWQWSVDLPAYLWWNHFERNMMAFEDLQCMELLQ